MLGSIASDAINKRLVSTEHLSAFVERVIAGVISFDIMKTVMI